MACGTCPAHVYAHVYTDNTTNRQNHAAYREGAGAYASKWREVRLMAARVPVDWRGELPAVTGAGASSFVSRAGHGPKSIHGSIHPIAIGPVDIFSSPADPVAKPSPLPLGANIP